eukprot:CAMPEP_0170499950 /NCGR_PEP_ID=MMETSP0208-20121228/33193_1 /TAXON_ID=197538 /ORGANISM="Strombidium inclinatum, Strain S3" /LENGTH=48 /DNA_ID= /DNA_START= /DNA_END= /DNA_ORIENTATION=
MDDALRMNMVERLNDLVDDARCFLLRELASLFDVLEQFLAGAVLHHDV